MSKESLTKELLALTGGVAPLRLSVPTYKERPSFLTTKVSNWVWKPFTNSARSDDLVLHHWTKDSLETDEYPYAKFNKKISIIEYSDNDYNLLLHGITYINPADDKDPDWTKQETDYLFSLCREFDLRFIVIADRYQYEGKQRSIEDIKARYYFVCKSILRTRGKEHNEIKQFDYNKEREVERKANLEILYNRTAEQAAEEERLFHELKRREQLQKRWQKERDALLRLLCVYDTSEATSRYNSTLENKQRKKSTRDDPYDDTPMKKRKERKESLNDDVSSRRERDRIPPGVYLRSQRLSNVKANIAPKLASMLEEFGIPSTRPTMPTANTMAKYEELRQSISSLLELKKIVDRTELDLKTATLRLNELEAMDAEDRKAAASAGTLQERTRLFSSPSVSNRPDRKR